MLGYRQPDPEIVRRNLARPGVLAEVPQEGTFHLGAVSPQSAEACFQPPVAIRDAAIDEIRAVSPVLVQRDVIEKVRELVPAPDRLVVFSSTPAHHPPAPFAFAVMASNKE